MSKEEAYEKATMQELGGNPNGTRQDVIYAAMDLYAKEQAIAFDRWKVQEGWEWSTTKWAEHRKVFWHQCPVTEYLTEDQLWDKFIEHQKQQQ